MLEDLVQSIYACRIDQAVIGHVDIVIMDNDGDQSAASSAERLKEACVTPFQTHYFVHPRKGLAEVRNRILDKAREFSPDFVVFIDDDEIVSVEWLNELVNTILHTEGDFALGKVVPRFDADVSSSISTWFRHYRFGNHQAISLIDTNNLIIRTQFLEETRIRFDHRFNATGAEDTYFGVVALKSGASIFWAEDALAYERIPERRATLWWLTQRKYRGANSYVRILLLERSYPKLVRKAVSSVAYLVLGLASMPLVLLPTRFRYFGILKASEALGGLAGFVNLQYEEYSRSDIR